MFFVHIFRIYFLKISEGGGLWFMWPTSTPLSTPITLCGAAPLGLTFSLWGWRRRVFSTLCVSPKLHAWIHKGAITSKIKHATKLKTSPARLAQLLQPSVAFCFSLQPMTAHRPVRRHWLQAKTKCYWGLQQLCKSCRTCFKFYCMFYFTCDRSLNRSLTLQLKAIIHHINARNLID